MYPIAEKSGPPTVRCARRNAAASSCAPSLQTASPGQHAAVLPVAVRAGLTGRCYGKRVTADVPTAFWVTRPIVKPCTRMEKTTTQ